MCCFNTIFRVVTNFFQGVFYKLGIQIGRYAKVIIPICILLTAGLSCGLINLQNETNIEVLYTPTNSRASKDRVQYQGTFPDATGTYFLEQALTTEDKFGEILVRAKDGNVFSNTSLEEIRSHITAIKAISASSDGVLVRYTDVCAVRSGSCYVSGEVLTTDMVKAAFDAGTMTYPIWNGQRLDNLLGTISVNGGQLTSAQYLRVTFHLRQDSESYRSRATAWEAKYLKEVALLKTSATSISYATSQSLNEELNDNTGGDIIFFSITFSLMIFYATVIAGGDMVSSRTWASWAGVLAAGFGILSAFGLISLCGVKFVNIVAVMPFLIIGIGVDDMFLLMSSWAETYADKKKSIPEKMGMTFRSAGIGITITSLTDLLAFGIGASSVFVSVRNFCIYTGVAVIFTYLYQIFFFGSCLSLHGHRVNSERHCVTCKKTTSRAELREQGRSKCIIYCCGGSPPTERGQDERCFETIPRTMLPKILLNVFGYIIVIVLYMAYLGVSIWGAVNLQQGLELKNLVHSSSYYHSYADTNDNKFNNSFPLPFVFGPNTNYIDHETVTNIESLFKNAESDDFVEDGSLICWFHSYRNTPLYDSTSMSGFISGLKTFLSSSPLFQDDVIFDSSNSTITASRCYMFSTFIKASSDQGNLMLRMRNLADSSPLSVYVYYPAFIFFEQYVTILSSTLLTVGIALAVMTVVTFIFLPHPLLVFLVVLNIVSIVVGIFGFLHIWGLTLSSVTMIHLIMSVGFSVDFSVHVCSAYMLGDGDTRKEKVKHAITHAAGPILNGGLSSFLGIIALVFSTSYIFQSFFKIMFTVILFGMLHAVFILPVILCICGPINVGKLGSSPKIGNPPPSPEPDYPGANNDV